MQLQKTKADLQLTPDNSSPSVANSNLTPPRTKIDFPWISVNLPSVTRTPITKEPPGGGLSPPQHAMHDAFSAEHVVVSAVRASQGQGAGQGALMASEGGVCVQVFEG